jgi:hypothetical protein
LDNAIKAIEISTSNQGNPRLIEFAIRALVKIASNPARFLFEAWQLELALQNINSKFLLSKRN